MPYQIIKKRMASLAEGGKKEGDRDEDEGDGEGGETYPETTPLQDQRPESFPAINTVL